MESKLLTRKKKANCIFLLLLLGLLFFRFPFEILLALNKIPIPKMMGVYIYEDGTYLIIAILMILKRDSLSDYNLGFCSLIIFMISPVAELFSEYLEMKYASIGTVQSDLWFRIVISVCLLIVLLLYRCLSR